MEIKEAMEILEKDIHTEVPKAAISARKHDAAVRMALVALEKQIPVKPIILDQLNGDIDYECPMCGKQVMSDAETTIVANVVVNLIGVKLMRLIDADEFQKQIAGMAILNNYPPNKANALCELVDNQPTAFDVENVVSNLEQLKLDGACEYCGYCECLNECWDGDMSEEHAINMAIEIVKRGGLDES